MKTRCAWAWLLGMSVLGAVSSFSFHQQAETSAEIIRREVILGRFCYHLTEPEEVMARLGTPETDESRKDGGMIVREMSYGRAVLMFGRNAAGDFPFTLFRAAVDGEELDIGRGRLIVLKKKADLEKFDDFWGYRGLSLAGLDLRDERDLLERMPFDSLTLWPPAKMMPQGFDPLLRLEQGKNPGLGLRALHSRGIDGRGTGIAVIDQPLLLGHVEYTEAIVRYDAAGLAGFSPQFHGSLVAGVAVGRKLGVAPGAALSYFAVPMWDNDNAHYVEALKKIMELNISLPEAEKIRAVSISAGAFRNQPHFEEWLDVVRQVEEAGIFLVTCDREMFDYGILAWIPGSDPDRAQSFASSRYVAPSNVLRVPGAGRTTASFRGTDVYDFDTGGGMSLGAPYIAGLGVLAWQAAPGIRPRQIFEALAETAVRTEAGLVVDPAGFIERVQTMIKGERPGR